MRANFMCVRTSESRVNIWSVKYIKPVVAVASVCS